MPTTIQTTTGTARADELGCTLIHEHVLVGYPGWQLDAKAPKFIRSEGMSRAVDQMQELKACGVKTFLDPCPMDMGRDAEFLAEVSQKSGMNVICTTGAYFEEEGITYTFRHLTVEQIAEIYIKEIEDGIGETGIKAGAIKIATGAPKVSAYEHKLVTAGARAAKATGVPIISHTQAGCCGHDQIDIVTGEGVPAGQLLVGHCDGSSDADYHRTLAERGSFVGFDRFGISLFQPDEVRIDSVMKLVEAGHLQRIMVSHDSIMCWLGRPVPFAQKYDTLLEALPKWRPTHLFREILPKLRERGLSEEQIDTILVDNPRRLFEASGHPRPAH